MVNLSLTKRITFLLFSIALTLALLISFGVSRIIESHTLELVAHITGNYAKDILSNSVFPDIFTKPLTPRDYVYLNKVFEKEALTHNLAEIKIWDKHGTVLYSDDKGIIGKTYSLDKAKSVLNEVKGTQLDPKLVDVFCKLKLHN